VNAAGDRLQDTARQAALALPDVSHGYPFTPGLDVYKAPHSGSCHQPQSSPVGL
jgi:hypothetical protein